MTHHRRCCSFLCAILLACSLHFVGVLSGADNVPPEGFTALFNGEDLSGWKGLVADPPRRAKMSPDELEKAQAAADQSMRQHWKAEDGVIVFDGHGDSLCTAKDYADFELFVDWKILPAGDSGIYLRGSPQVQIWDREDGSGGLYNNQKNPSKPLVKADKPVGEWNTFKIRMVGERVTVHLNGTLVVDDVVMENYWERDKPIYPTGSIELQNHGNTLYFKNIYVRELPPAAARPVLEKGDRVAIAGDSITEQKIYSRFIEDYLTACVPELDLRVAQLGWSGERAPGFAGRMENDLLGFRPTDVTTCYGMNDGQYRAYEPSIGETYGRAMKDIVRRLKEAGVTVVVGSPGAVDTFAFKNPNTPPKVYNENLGQLGDIASRIAAEEGMPFANVHDALMSAMQKAKAAFGDTFDVCGGDGVHPNADGQLVMAYAFLKAMGLRGDLGTITMDLKGSASATGGHKVLASGARSVEVESSRYPFCFYGDPRSPGATRSIVPFVPFNEDLNRLTLVVKNLDAPRAKVKWGEGEKSFSREQLEKGINLAAEFLDNPFSEPFRKVDELVARKQGYETPMIKEIVTRFRVIRDLLGDDPEGKAAVENLRAVFWKKDDALAAQVRAALQPVKHTVEIVPE